MSGHGMDVGVARKASEFLFGEGDATEWQNLIQRTDIPTDAMFKALFYYSYLQQAYGCKEAGIVATLLKGSLLSLGRKSRLEGVAVLQQGKLPHTDKIYSSIEGIVSEERQPGSE